MLTLYHAPNTRSSGIVTLIDELGIRDAVDIRIVDIPRTQTGAGKPDPSNPHPEKKVPFLVDGDDWVRERGAIMLYLTDMFPAAGLGPLPGEAKRGQYLSWLSYYQGVMEPVFNFAFAKLQHPVLTSTFRGIGEVYARIGEALEKGPYLLGDRYSAADLLVHSPFVWMPDAMPDTAVFRDWVKRCADRPAARRTAEWDAALLAG